MIDILFGNGTILFMFRSRNRRNLLKGCKSVVALTTIAAWLTAMSYCSFAGAFACKPSNSHEAVCHADTHSHSEDSDSHSPESLPKQQNDEPCCKALQIVVAPTSNVSVQTPAPSYVFWILREVSLFQERELAQSGSLFLFDHDPPGLPIILFSLRHSHQENAPPFFV